MYRFESNLFAAPRGWTAVSLLEDDVPVRGYLMRVEEGRVGPDPCVLGIRLIDLETAESVWRPYPDANVATAADVIRAFGLTMPEPVPQF